MEVFDDVIEGEGLFSVQRSTVAATLETWLCRHVIIESRSMHASTISIWIWLCKFFFLFFVTHACASVEYIILIQWIQCIFFFFFLNKKRGKYILNVRGYICFRICWLSLVHWVHTHKANCFSDWLRWLTWQQSVYSGEGEDDRKKEKNKTKVNVAKKMELRRRQQNSQWSP